jgi:ribosome maturation factor RimP
MGKPVRVWMRELVDGRRDLAGRLAQVDGDTLILLTPEGPRSVLRSLVTKARLEVEPRGSAESRRE